MLRKYQTSPAGVSRGEVSIPDAPHSESVPMGRRDFLRLVGFSFAAGALWNGCSRAPVQELIPYLVSPENIVPGQSVWQTAICAACPAGCGMLVKIRDGRPIKLEGNPDHPISRGGLCPVGQASLLGLYDEKRLSAPLIGGVPVEWEEIDRKVLTGLSEAVKSGGSIRIITGSLTSPTAIALLNRFIAQYPTAKRVIYDPISYSTVLDAHQATHRRRVLPRYNFSLAEVIVSFDADFLGTWISPVEYTAGYAPGRNPDRFSPPSMTYHIQFESRLTITGSKADDRYALNSYQIFAALIELAIELSHRAGVRLPDTGRGDLKLGAEVISRLADRLWANRRKSLVVCGLQDLQAQITCNFINHLLQNYGSTIDIDHPSYQWQGSDPDLRQLLDEIQADQVAALIIWGVNPVYDLPEGQALSEKILQIPLTVAISERPNETTAVAKYVCAESNALESWNDFEPVAGVTAISQPAIAPFGNTRTLTEILASWLAIPGTAADLIRSHWDKEIFPRSMSGHTPDVLWRVALQSGFLSVLPREISKSEFNFDAVKAIHIESKAPDGYWLDLHQTASMLDGRHAYNPYLFELPDPITKTTWDNVAALSPHTATRISVKQGDILHIESGERAIELPVYISPGMADEVIAVSLGYGRNESARFSKIGPQWLLGASSTGDNGLVGINAAPLVRWRNGQRLFSVSGVSVKRTGRLRLLACTQEHGDLNERNSRLFPGTLPPVIINEATLEEYRSDPHSIIQHHPTEGYNLWPEDHSYPIHRWAMVIDLNKCTGCSACIISCNIENNIPVVGRDEVRRNRELHWLRIDRYYSEDDGHLDISFLPMLCQHCDHAPCETVCPVIATSHSEEGLNQQTYNRCVGTRYCANNCPYKVRRFNWFNYPFARKGRERMILNPDVTVRSRGVMEKCTFCVQRIQEAKANAKMEGRKIADGEIKLACQQSCPASAIVFGDLNDPNSEVAKLMQNHRQYKVLEELNVRPAVGYLAIIRNRDGWTGEYDPPANMSVVDHNG